MRYDDKYECEDYGHHAQYNVGDDVDDDNNDDFLEADLSDQSDGGQGEEGGK